MPYVPTRTPDTQQKLTVLYALEHLGPCYDMQLLRFFGDKGLMNWFDIVFALVDLCRDGQTVRTNRVNQNLYEITDSGRETLQLLYAHVPLSVRDEIEQNAAEWKKRFSKEQEYASEICQTEGGETELKMYIMEQGMRMLSLSMTLPDEHTAMALQQKWPGIADSVYSYIISRFMEAEG